MPLVRNGVHALTVVFLVTLTVLPLAAQERVESANWEQADKYTSTYLRQFSYSTSVRPRWLGDSDRFWYEFKTSAGNKYWLVDAKARTKIPLFDHARMAALISEATGNAQVANALSLSGLRVSSDGKKLDFTAGGWRLTYHTDKDSIEKRGKTRTSSRGRSRGAPGSRGSGNTEQRRQQLRERFGLGSGRRGGRGGSARRGGGRGSIGRRGSTSPDRKVQVFSKEHNLFVVEGKPATAAAKKNDKPEVRPAAAKGGDAKNGKGDTKNAAAKNGKGKTTGKDGEKSLDAAKTEGNTAEKSEAKKRIGSEDMSDGDIDDFLRRVAAGEKLDANKVTGTRRAPRLVFDDKNAIQLTKDGEVDYSFGSSTGRRSSASVSWSADSSAFYTRRRDSRGIAELSLVDSIAEPRPKVRNYKYPMPGEDKVRKTEMHVYHRETNKLLRVKPRWKDESYSSIQWMDNGELRILRTSRVKRDIEYGVVDPKTGEVKTLLAESVQKGNLNTQSMRWLKDKKSFVWWSERTGWGHFYLYGVDGKLKNAITKGPFRASRIVSLDEEKGVMWFRGNAREPGENVYYNHLYRVNLDGTGLTLLDPGDANHSTTLSPSKQFVVDNTSRVDRAPTSTLRDAQGNEIMQLETCDVSRLLEAGWRFPESFKVKAADGVTDLYGNMWKPFDFDPKKRYPVVLSVYPGPQQEGVSHTFSTTGSRQQLAQLGFIVIQVGHRGGTPTRDRAYGSYGYWNLRDYGLADKKAAVEQLARRHAFVDVTRVGMYGHSGGGFMTAAALMKPPYNEFFTVGVASSGNHDNNIYNSSWGERYHGLKEVPIVENKDAKKDASKDADKDAGKDAKKNAKKGAAKPTDPKTKFDIKIPTNAELAPNLKGRLLLVHGEIDNNVHPANTMRLVDALIKANKRFDLLIIPGARHGFGRAQGYFTRRMWEYFVEHLMGERTSGVDMPVPTRSTTSPRGSRGTSTVERRRGS